MKISARSALIAGVTTLTASAVLIAPSVQPLPPPKTKIQLVADVQPTAQPADYFSQLASWWQPIFLPSASQPFPTPPTEPLPTPGSITSSLEGAYHAIEPWVRYGFEIATYAVGWIPWVGWLSGQIMIFYNFGERIVHAITHNTLDWLGGNGSFLQNLGEGISWSIDALIQLGKDEWNFFLPPLPPLPPLPCIFGCNNLSELNAPLDGIRVGLRDTVTGLLQQLSDSLPSRDPEQPPPPPIVTSPVMTDFTAAGSDLKAQVSQVPTTIIDALNPTGATEDTVAPKLPDVLPGLKGPGQVLTSVIETPGKLLKGAVQAQGEVRGAAAETTADDSLSPAGRARGPVREAVTNTATTVTKRLTDTARDAAATVNKATDDTSSSVKKATDNARTSLKKGKSGDE